MKNKTQRLACIDIGSNAIKYRQYRISKQKSKNFAELDTFKRISVRLGTDAFKFKKISSETEQKLLKSIMKLKDKADKKDVKIITGVATSAMRTASNGHKICKKIRKKTDIEIKILSGNEEAQLLNFFNYKDFKKDETLVVDIGGGSTELFHHGNGKLLAKSFPLGAVRILEGKDSPKHWDNLKEWLTKIPSENIKNIVGVGGNARLINEIINRQNRKSSLEELKVLKKELSNKSFEEKISSYSLPEDRADILEHAIAIFMGIIEFFPNSFLFDSSWNIADAVMEKELQENKNIQAA